MTGASEATLGVSGDLELSLSGEAPTTGARRRVLRPTLRFGLPLTSILVTAGVEGARVGTGDL